MPDTLPENSVGLVTAQTMHFDVPLALACGRSFDNYDITYETYGELNSDHSNAILICHALSSDHHAAGYHSMEDRKPGWWETCIGPGKVIDTNHFFVVCMNNLGGCKGSTGPASTNPETNKPYGPDFPIVTVKDWVESQARFTDKLEIKTWLAIIGGSLGGMQVLQWNIDFPERIKHAAVIAAAPKLTAQNIGFNEVARQAIMHDVDFHDGRYYEHDTVPRRGLMLARMLGHITYLSDDAMREKFGRELRQGKISYGFDVDFQVESYLRYQGESFVDRFDANTYLLMTKALDYFDPAADFDDDLSKALSHAQANFLVISFSSDWRFAPERSREIVKALQNNNHDVSYAEVVVPHGHDAFLMPINDYLDVFGAWMGHLVKEVSS
ncbi:MAG: homoserine O-acetyltransferase [Sulfuriflexus sp.]|nr:homoserine O-acetyltransferase [Sulfuriflexus sp.]